AERAVKRGLTGHREAAAVAVEDVLHGRVGEVGDTTGEAGQERIKAGLLYSQQATKSTSRQQQLLFFYPNSIAERCNLQH
ncbi:unnamed protein product, partial [Urochloa humidicola]